MRARCCPRYYVALFALVTACGLSRTSNSTIDLRQRFIQGRDYINTTTTINRTTMAGVTRVDRTTLVTVRSVIQGGTIGTSDIEWRTTVKDVRTSVMVGGKQQPAVIPHAAFIGSRYRAGIAANGTVTVDELTFNKPAILRMKNGDTVLSTLQAFYSAQQLQRMLRTELTSAPSRSASVGESWSLVAPSPATPDATTYVHWKLEAIENDIAILSFQTIHDNIVMLGKVQLDYRRGYVVSLRSTAKMRGGHPTGAEEETIMETRLR